MADYTLSELKTLVLDQINQIKGLSTAFVSTDSDEAYDWATMQCGFTIPDSTDTDKDKKFEWLIQRQRRWYMGRLRDIYSLRFDAGELRAGQIAKNLMTICETLDAAFNAAKNDAATASLFADSQAIFTDDVVSGPGLVDDRFGQDISVVMGWRS